MAAQDRPFRPALRPVETIMVQDPREGRVLVLRDTQGVTDARACIPLELVPVVARFTGTKTCGEIAREVSREIGVAVPEAVVVRLAYELERGLFLEGPLFEEAAARVAREFEAARVRAASHAGGAYHGDPAKLRRYLDDACLGAAADGARGANGKNADGKNANGKKADGDGAKGANADAARPSGKSGSSRGEGVRAPNGRRATAAAAAKDATGGRGARGAERRRLVGLVAPHIDPWRGAIGYGHAYGALARALPEEADTFVLFGTSHAPMRRPFALCRKAFDTPLGPLDADVAAIDAIAARAPFDVFADQINHKREHSLEFQAVFLRHLLGARPARIVPILASIGDHQARGTNPAGDRAVGDLLGAVGDLVAERGARVVVIAGADLAHVGPRFGDPRGYDETERAVLDATDRASLEHALSGDAGAFWDHVAADLDTRRVCGLAPIYSLLRALAPTGPADAELLHYEQTIDADDGGSIVSHAAVGFYR